MGLEKGEPTEETTLLNSGGSAVNINSPTYTVSEAIETVGVGPFQTVFLLTVCGVSVFAEATEMMLLSFLAIVLRCEWDLAEWQVALTVTVVFAGEFLGGVLWGAISDRWGRRWGFLGATLVTVVFGFLSATSESFVWMCTWRCLVGVGLSGVVVSVSIYSEFLPVKSRSFYLILIQAWWTVGTFAEAGIAWLVLPNLGWRWLLVISTIPVFLSLLTFPFLPESPRFLVSKGRSAEAEAVLIRCAKWNYNTALPPGHLVASKPTKSQNLLHALKGKFGITTFILFFAWFTVAMCYYGSTLLTAELYHDETRLVKGQCNNISNDDFEQVLITTSAEMPGILLTLFTIELTGRRLTISSFTGVSGICLIITIAVLPRIAEIAMMFIARGGTAAVFNVLYIYTLEVYPTTLRTSALGWCFSFGRFGGISSPYVVEYMLRMQRELPMMTMGVFLVVCALVVMCLPWETKGRTMQDRLPSKAKIIVPKQKNDSKDSSSDGSESGYGATHTTYENPQSPGVRTLRGSPF